MEDAAGRRCGHSLGRHYFSPSHQLSTRHPELLAHASIYRESTATPPLSVIVMNPRLCWRADVTRGARRGAWCGVGTDKPTQMQHVSNTHNIEFEGYMC